MSGKRFSVFVIGLLVATGACTPAPDGEQILAEAQARFTSEDQASWIETLASDEFEGRGPSSPGEEKTIAFLEEEFKRLGLAPGNGSSYLQEVPLVDITVEGAPKLTIAGRGADRELIFAQDSVFWTKRVLEEISLASSELVFVGYGTVAPEYGWNDYAEADIAGKTALILDNDPGYATEDQALFNGRTMTYYGRWTYKYEEAARQGAAGALIIHDLGPAGYGWDTVRNSWTGPQFDLVSPDGNASRVAVEGWLTAPVSEVLFRQAGLDLSDLKRRAATADFKAIPLGMTVSTQFSNRVRRSTSHNVAARLPGSTQPDEHVIYMAHWDHLGRDASLEGDQIYNGALDNATGMAGLLGLSKAFASLSVSPQRSVLFLAVTAEEQGLLGSAYYGANPIISAAQTVAAINMDGMNLHGPMNDITVIGYGNSELDDYVDEAAASQARRVRSDPEPEKGYYYRSDHFSLAKHGIPALYTDAGIDSAEHGEAWTLERRQQYLDNDYHRLSDEYDPNWDLSGTIQDLQLLMRIGYRLANSDAWPNWREGTEFRKLREDTMQGR